MPSPFKSLAGAVARLKRITGLGSFAVPEHFQRIYRDNLFAGTESRSGKGSALDQTAIVRNELPRLLVEFGIRKLLDAPCGDCHWIAELDWTRVPYIGVDVVPDLIAANRSRLSARGMEFSVANLCDDPLPRAGLILCRDCWVHLDFRQIAACLRNFRHSGSQYLLTTTFPRLRSNRNLRMAIWRPLNLQVAPFYFPPPLRLIEEGCTEKGNYGDKSLGLWRIEDLPG
jgi:hypothetical protein